MLRLLSLRATAVAVVAVALAASTLVGPAPQPAVAGPTIHKVDKASKKAQKQFRKAAASHIRFMRRELNGFLKGYCSDVDDVAAGVADGSLDGFAAINALTLANNLAYGLAVGVALNIVLPTGAVDVNTAHQSIPDADSKVTGLLQGECGPWDDFVDDVRIELDRFQGRLNKKLKKILKAVNKRKQIVANGQLGVIAPPMPAPPIAAALPPPPKTFTMDSKASAATVGQENSGVICVGGQADPNVSNGVDVVLFDAKGEEVGRAAARIGNDCRWRVCFPTSLPATLPSGTYRIVAKRSEDASGISADFSVPSTGPEIRTR